SSFIELKSKLESALVADGTLWCSQQRRATPADIRTRIDALQSAISELRTWCNWRRVRADAASAGLLPLIAAYENTELPDNALRDTFDRSFYQLWMERTIESEPVLSQFFSFEFERKIDEFRALDKRYMKLAQAEIRARLAARRPISSDRVNQNSE